MNKRNLILAMLAAGCVTASASPLDFDGTAKTASYAHNGKDIISGAYVTAILADDTEIDSRSYPQV